jgi:ERCC4-related helicase
VLEVSGQLPAHKRTQLYETHQVVFATPQTIENDLENGRIDGRRVVLLVFDECHRAVGNFSYCQIIKLMNRLDVGFRVVGLSATPGSEHEKVQEVISRLNISRIVYRDENEPEVSRYLHSKTLHEVEIPENAIIKEALAHLEKFAAPSLGLLAKLQILEPWMIRKGLAGTSFYLIREKFGERIDSVEPGMKALAFAAFKILCFLSRCRKSLNDQGYQTFKLQFFAEIEPPKPAKLQPQ